MSEPGNWRPSYVIVALMILLVGVLAYLVATVLDTGTGETARIVEAGETGEAVEAPGGGGAPLPIAAEAGPFRGNPPAPRGGAVAAPKPAGRHLDVFYERRAYPGAPPYIPHEVEDDAGAQGQTCLRCHESGGYVARFSAFAPTTPHPEYLNCRQCHVTQQKRAAPFKGNRWVKIAGPRLGLSALPGGPPQIPHGLQLREYCVACHSGGGALSEIATSHPERGNCRQCHVPSVVTSTWSRP